jgi:hypothetical protein
MSTLEIEIGDLQATSVEVTGTELIVTLADGRKIATPLAWYPRLKRATAAERMNYEIMPPASIGLLSTKISASPGCCRDGVPHVERRP